MRACDIVRFVAGGSAPPPAASGAPILRPAVYGLDLDPQSRCAHWHGPLDVVALKMRCCGCYYACRECHDALADHPAELWPAAERDRPAVMCGVCGGEMTVAEYLACDDRCPRCAAAFNPGCRKHRHLYFEDAGAAAG